MVFTKTKGYRAERKVRLMFEKAGWNVVRAGASLGEADLICIKNKKCVLLQIKSTKKKTFYYYDYIESRLEGFPFFAIVDFGYGKIRIVKPKHKIKIADGKDLKEFLHKI